MRILSTSWKPEKSHPLPSIWAAYITNNFYELSVAWGLVPHQLNPKLPLPLNLSSPGLDCNWILGLCGSQFWQEQKGCIPNPSRNIVSLYSTHLNYLTLPKGQDNHPPWSFSRYQAKPLPINLYPLPLKKSFSPLPLKSSL